MKIEIINESAKRLNNKLFEKIFDWFIDDELFKKKDFCCLKIVGNDEIRSVNKKYRGINENTDVLSFPSQCKVTSFIGDILINIEIIEQQKIAHTLEQELAILFIHGLLHLKGMDHISTKEKETMLFYENKYRNKLVSLIPFYQLKTKE